MMIFPVERVEAAAGVPKEIEYFCNITYKLSRHH